jgi:hypothetical protein
MPRANPTPGPVRVVRAEVRRIADVSDTGVEVEISVQEWDRTRQD